MIRVENIFARYGMPNDLLITLNIFHLRVVDVPVRLVYADEVSKLKIRRVLFSISWLMLQLFFKRIFHKYVIRDFHPLVLFYGIGIMLGLASLGFLARILIIWYLVGDIPDITFLAFLFCSISSLQLMLFAMLFDMEYNNDLKGS